MARKRKTEIHMIDMTSRMHIKIVETTIEEEDALQKELDDINIIIERRMKEYEDSLQKLIKSVETCDVIDITEKDTDYFIENYKQRYKNRNIENIRKKMRDYLKLIEEHS